MPAPEVFTSASDMRGWTRAQRRQGRTVALVPTMGNLHEGHLALVDAAKGEADEVVVSIYVNPTQFAAHEDFGVYPRTLAEDLAKLQQRGVAAVFQPASLYARGRAVAARAPSEEGLVVGSSGAAASGAHETFIQVEQLQQGLCGRSRPHFFRGVATVVAKLFNIVEPDVAVFGQKDYQQWRLLCRMARDLDMPVAVRGLPTVREADGLAMSSRNLRLSPEAWRSALSIYSSLQEAARLGAECRRGGRPCSPASLQALVVERVGAAGGCVDYVEVVDAEELRPVGDACAQATLVAVAAVFGGVRLIDNVVLPGPASGPGEPP